MNQQELVIDSNDPKYVNKTFQIAVNATDYQQRQLTSYLNVTVLGDNSTAFKIKRNY